VYAAILGIGLIAGVYFVNSSKRDHAEERDRLWMEGDFAIGEFGGRVKSRGRVSGVYYFYQIEDKKYKAGDTHVYLDSDEASSAFIDDDLADKGDRFLIIYDKDDPENSIIRLDYKILDSADFQRIIKEVLAQRDI
jgi:hypothetical protein